MPASNSIRAKLELDTTPFERGMKQATAVADETAAKLHRTFGAVDFFKGILQGIGIGSVEAVLERFTAYWKDSADYAQAVERASAQALENQIKMMSLQQTPAQQLATLKTSIMAQRKDDLDKANADVAAIRNDPGPFAHADEDTLFSDDQRTQSQLDTARKAANEAALRHGGGTYTRNASTLAAAVDAQSAAQKAMDDLKAQIITLSKDTSAGRAEADDSAFEQSQAAASSRLTARLDSKKAELEAEKQSNEEWIQEAQENELRRSAVDLATVDPVASAALSARLAAATARRDAKRAADKKAREAETHDFTLDESKQQGIEAAQVEALRQRYGVTNPEAADAQALKNKQAQEGRLAQHLDLLKAMTTTESLSQQEIDTNTKLLQLDIARSEEVRKRTQLQANQADAERQKYGFTLAEVESGTRGNADDRAKARQIERLQARARHLYDLGTQDFTDSKGNHVQAQVLAGQVQTQIDGLLAHFDRLGQNERDPGLAFKIALKESEDRLAAIERSLAGVDPTGPTTGTAAYSGSGSSASASSAPGPGAPPPSPGRTTVNPHGNGSQSFMGGGTDTSSPQRDGFGATPTLGDVPADGSS